jgi:hypothetical protein
MGGNGACRMRSTTCAVEDPSNGNAPVVSWGRSEGEAEGEKVHNTNRKNANIPGICIHRNSTHRNPGSVS